MPEDTSDHYSWVSALGTQWVYGVQVREAEDPARHRPGTMARSDPALSADRAEVENPASHSIRCYVLCQRNTKAQGELARGHQQ